ncbi:MAG TPA: serine hydrolase, partial [Aggregatilineales bacterium]|nr:serine hydrolase [Aggregatilineales bacterium]
HGTPSPVAGDPKLAALASQLYDYLLGQNYAPYSEQVASLFILDLQTGASYSLYPGVAYSGMSLIKIPILVTLYRKIGKLPTNLETGWIAQMMVCSDNLASNAILRFIGNGDPFKGGGEVTTVMAQLGLTDTFLLSPFSDDPSITPEPVQTIKTDVDQTTAGPDSLNQTSPASLGWLLHDIYQCALDGSGPLVDTFSDAFDTNKCRQMLRALSADRIGKLFEAGLPPGTLIAHKHGWIDDTRGDAAIIFTPGGNYILTLEMHTRSNQFSDYKGTFLVASEVSRLVYNAYNPDRPVDAVEEDPNATQHCDPGANLIADLGRSDLPMIGVGASQATPTPLPMLPK